MVTTGLTELPVERTRHSKRFSNPVGGNITLLTSNLHYNSGGLWEDQDLTYHQVGTRFIADKNDIGVTLADNLVELQDVSGRGIRWTAPGSLTSIDNQKAKIGDWEYSLTTRGVTSMLTVTAKVGPKTYSFPFTLLGTSPEFREDVDGSSVSGDIRVPRAVVKTADKLKLPCSPWMRTGDVLYFTFDDSLLPPSAFPYIIDPTTDLQPSDGIDTYIQSGGPTTVRGTVAQANMGDPDAGAADALRVLLKFDLTSISSSHEVSAVTLTLRALSGGDGDTLTPWDVDVNRVLQDWVEAEATWNNYKSSTAWPGSGGASTDGTDRVATESAVTEVVQSGFPKDVTFSGSVMTTDVDNWVNGSVDNFGWLIASESVENRASAVAVIVVGLSDHATAGNRPRLLVTHDTAVPPFTPRSIIF